MHSWNIFFSLVSTRRTPTTRWARCKRSETALVIEHWHLSRLTLRSRSVITALAVWEETGQWAMFGVPTHSLQESMNRMLGKKTHSKSGKKPKMCAGRQRIGKKTKNNRKAVRLTKISLNAFNGAERAVCLRHTAPVKAPFGGFCSWEYLWRSSGPLMAWLGNRVYQRRANRENTEITRGSHSVTTHTHTHTHTHTLSELAHITPSRSYMKTPKRTTDW